MERKILVLSDSINPRKEAVQYSLGLARRLEAVVVALSLLDSEAGVRPAGARDRSREREAEQALGRNLRELSHDGDVVEAWVRFGDPVSEVIKFLAGAGAYQAIIWGGDESVGERGDSRSHWLFKVKGLVECPLMIPSKKTDRGRL
jgi:hypothetical protein